MFHYTYLNSERDDFSHAISRYANSRIFAASIILTSKIDPKSKVISKYYKTLVFEIQKGL